MKPLAFLALALLAALAVGCTGSAIHASAVAAHSAFVVETAGGEAIVSTETAALAACPHDDGLQRTHCVATVASVGRAAAGIHDALAPAVLAWRAATLTACGVDPSAPNPPIPDACPPDSPEVVSMLESMAAPVVAALPSLTAAIRTLSTLAQGSR